MRRAYLRAHKLKSREYNQRNYAKHSRERIATEMSRYWAIRKSPLRHAAYLRKRREQERRRMANPEYASRRRKQKAAIDAKRIRLY